MVQTSNAFSRPTELPFPLASYPHIGPTGEEGVVVRRTSRLKTYYDDVICQWPHGDNRIDVVVSHSQPAVHGWNQYALRSPKLWTRIVRSKQVFLLISDTCGLQVVVIFFVEGVRIFLQAQKYTLVDLPSGVQSTDKDKFACFAQGCVI